MSEMRKYNPYEGNQRWSVYLVRSVENYPSGQCSERGRARMGDMRCTRCQQGQKPSISIAKCPFLLEKVASFGYPDEVDRIPSHEFQQGGGVPELPEIRC